MAQEQKIITPLVESEIQVEPRTPPGMPLNTRIQRVWSMLFGRRENTLQPVYASRAGMLGIVAFDLNGWTLEYNAVPNEDWTDMGKLVDLVCYIGSDSNDVAPHIEFGPTTGVVQYVSLPTTAGISEPIGGTFNMLTGSLCARVRWYHGVNIFADASRVIAYTAPKR